MLNRRATLGAAGLLAYPAQAWAASGRVLNAMMTDDPAHLNLPLFNTTILQEICGNINESLLLFDWQFKPHPNLARAFEMSPDGLTYTFHLRTDVQWHDGVKFTARDVVFSCGVILPQLNPRSRAAFSHIEGIKTPDRNTIEIRLNQPFNAFLLSFMASSAPMMPAHIYEGADFRTNPYNLKPIGTGPQPIASPRIAASTSNARLQRRHFSNASAIASSTRMSSTVRVMGSVDGQSGRVGVRLCRARSASIEKYMLSHCASLVRLGHRSRSGP